MPSSSGHQSWCLTPFSLSFTHEVKDDNVQKSLKVRPRWHDKSQAHSMGRQMQCVVLEFKPWTTKPLLQLDLCMWHSPDQWHKSISVSGLLLGLPLPGGILELRYFPCYQLVLFSKRRSDSTQWSRPTPGWPPLYFPITRDKQAPIWLQSKPDSIMKHASANALCPADSVPLFLYSWKGVYLGKRLQWYNYL